MIGLKKGELVFYNYTSQWQELFSQEKIRITKVIGSYVVDIQHVGSTSIPGMLAKPIIDIAIAVNNFEEAQVCIEPLINVGYDYKGEYGISRRHYFIKGDPVTHHVHMNEITSQDWKKQIFFRDYLIRYPKYAKQYADLKIQLRNKFKIDREKYQDAKGPFITRILKLAGLDSNGKTSLTN